MVWTQLKKHIEGRFAESLANRIELRSTRFRNRLEDYYHDQKIWITLDKEVLVEFSDSHFRHRKNKEALKQWISKDKRTLNSASDYYEAAYRTKLDAEALLKKTGFLTPYDISTALHEYLNLGIDESLNSDNVVIRAFSIIDKRVGKRRLVKMDVSNEHEIIQKFFNIRCNAENISIGRLQPK